MAVAVIALAVAGYGGSGTRVIAWTGRRPPVAPAPSLARPCRASDLRVTSDEQGNAGQVFAGEGVTNTGSQPCSLVGRPDVSSIGPSLVVHGVGRLGYEPIDYLPISSLRALGPGEQASLTMAWPDARDCVRRRVELLVALSGSRSSFRGPPIGNLWQLDTANGPGGDADVVVTG